MTWAIRWGGDTVMDLPRKHITKRASGSSVTRLSPLDGADLPGAREGGRESRGYHLEVFRDTLVEQAEQGVDYFTIHAGYGCRTFRSRQNV